MAQTWLPLKLGAIPGSCLAHREVGSSLACSFESESVFEEWEDKQFASTEEQFDNFEKGLRAEIKEWEGRYNELVGKTLQGTANQEMSMGLALETTMFNTQVVPSTLDPP